MLGDVQDIPTTLTGQQRQRVVADAMRQELMDLVARRETTRASAPMANSAGAYTDPVRFEAEKRALFLNSPLLVGFSRDIAEPGGKILFSHAGPSILVTRGKDRAIRAFLNMCPHRAAEVVTECRNSKLMTCPFHGWTFDLEGKLVGMPRKEGFEGLSREALGLVRVPAVEWNGMIFVIPRAGDETIDMNAHLGTFTPEIAQIDFASAKAVATTRLEAGANWKMAVDTFGESYHLTVLHPETVGKAAISDVLLYQGFPPHHRIGFPLLSMADDVGKPEAEWRDRPYSAIHLIFPNTLIHVTTLGPGNTYFVYRVFPVDVGTSYTILTTYRSGDVADDADPAPWIELHDYQAMVVGSEDYSVVTGAQRNLRYAPDDFHVVYGTNEVALQGFHRAIDAKLAASGA